MFFGVEGIIEKNQFLEESNLEKYAERILCRIDRNTFEKHQVIELESWDDIQDQSIF